MTPKDRQRARAKAELKAAAESDVYPDFDSAVEFPLQAILQCRETYRRDYTSHNEKMYQALATGMAAALALCDDRDDWEKFVGHVNAHGLRDKKIRVDKDYIHCASMVTEVIFLPTHGDANAKKKGRAIEFLVFNNVKPFEALNMFRLHGLERIVKEAESQLSLLGLNDDEKAEKKRAFRDGAGSGLKSLLSRTDRVQISGTPKSVRKIDLSQYLVVKCDAALLLKASAANDGKVMVLEVESGGLDGGHLKLSLLRVLEIF